MTPAPSSGQLPSGLGPFAYSLTLPAAPPSAGVARAAIRTTLDAHGLTSLLFPAVLLVSELVVAATHFTPSPDIYVSLRYREEACAADVDPPGPGTLRLIAYDGHPPHTSPHLGALCDARRRTALRVLAAVVEACHGTWGFGASPEPGGGTRTWATISNSGPAATW
ncbi:ATP-binding protein [Streptomyces triticagri]|uniref:ATP-binding protein n=1 Tax=Streptomyces triticagri TaxID=2293568 RepID=A0A372M7G3_9ACTN|nr:ATP-binding protein [Streptomyces triticagri]